MDERRLDAGVAEVVTGLLHLRRTLDPATYLDLLGAIMVEIEEGMEVALERRHQRKAEGNVVPFPPAGPALPREGRD
ncbi:hypothetical protein [Methylobacterium oryzae]|uniref:Uncharacterized protein n=1 Tax=Methylobacterium oryzae TaxID=334852 RepID=A0ABU7TKU9_9HYPH